MPPPYRPPGSRRPPVQAKHTSSVRNAIFAVLAAIVVLGIVFGAFNVPKPRPYDDASAAAAAAPAQQGSEAQRAWAHLDDMQRLSDGLAIDAFGPRGTAAVMKAWAARETARDQLDYQQLPLSIVAVRHVEPATGRRGVRPQYLANHEWQRIAPALGVTLDDRTSNAYGGPLARPDGTARAVFVDVRLTMLPDKPRYVLEWRAVTCEPPSSSRDFTLVKTTAWQPIAEFFDAVVVTRAVRPAGAGSSAREAHLLFAIADGAPRHFVLRIDNADVVTLTESGSTPKPATKPATKPAVK